MLRAKGSHNYGFQPSLFRDGILTAILALFTGAFEFLAAFLIWPATAILAAVMRIEWPSSVYVIGFLVVVPVVIGAMLWTLAQKNDKGAAVHITVVSICLSALLIAIDVVGWAKFNIFMMVCGVPLLCLTLAIRIVMQNRKSSGFDHIFASAGADGGNLKLYHIDEESDEDEDHMA